MRPERLRLGLTVGIVTAVLVGAFVFFLVWERGPSNVQVRDGRPVSAQAPIRKEQDLPPTRTPREAFERHCAGCHGLDAGGGLKGPPLVHVIYRSAHHSDVAFTLAVRRGAAAHHWRFGDMPPQPAVTPAELDDIVRYVRDLQRARGIE